MASYKITKKLLENRYSAKRKSICQIANKFNCSPQNIFYFLKKYGIAIRSGSESHKGKKLTIKWKENISKGCKGIPKPWKSGRRAIRKHKLDEYYFCQIDSEGKAYWLGFLYADGNVSANSKFWYRLSVGLQKRDRNHLAKLLKSLNASYSIGEYSIRNKYLVSSINIYSKQLILDLIKQGCVPKKSLIIKFPNLSPKLIRHFIRGYFDGDGCISGNHMSICSGSRKFLATLQNHLVSFTRIPKGTISKVKNSPCYYFQYVGKHLSKIYKYMYAGGTIYLERKHLKFMEVI